MLNYNKRNMIIITMLISVVIYVSINFILIKFYENQKKENNKNLILKTSNINPVENNINQEKKQVSNENQNIVQELIPKNQYKNYNWRILIPKINLDAPILEGTSKEVLRKGVGHFKDTTTLEGNVCLAAHNRGYKYNYFEQINLLNVGDIIEYKLSNEIKKYKVVENKKIYETDLSCLEETNENKLTLITCVKNEPEYRTCIQAIEI